MTATVTTMVAGIGNIFLSDDAFGCELARRLTAETLPDGVRVADYGIRGMHLAYDLLDMAPATTILLDAVSRGGETPVGVVELRALDTRVPLGGEAEHVGQVLDGV